MREVSFFGEFYRRTTAPFLSPMVTREEGLFLGSHLEAGRTLDLGCGEGRHLEVLSRPGLVGLDFDPGALAVAQRFAPVVCGDLRALPFPARAFEGCFCWYSTLFVFDEAGNQRALEEAARVLRPGGRFLFQTVNPAHLAAQPEASFERRLPDGSLLRERSAFDLEAGVDRGLRTLVSPEGEACCARYALRYYRLDELVPRFQAAGLRVLQTFGSVLGEAFGPDSSDLLVLASRDP